MQHIKYNEILLIVFKAYYLYVAKRVDVIFNRKIKGYWLLRINERKIRRCIFQKSYQREICLILLC